MLQLLNPIWLFGIAGILIPLVIHLWNVKTGKTLKVGSIALMGESSRQNSRSLRLMDLLLLFLRCLMIFLLSVLLAEPVWRSAVKKEERKAWVLVEKDAFSETYSNFQNEIDSQMTAGNELHLFQPGFESADIEELLKDTSSAEKSSMLPYWSLIKLMEKQIPYGSKAFIFTGDQLNRFKGPRPAITPSIVWKTYTPADSASKWINQAYLSTPGDIRAVVSESNPRGTVTKVVNISPGAVNSDIKASISNGRAELQLKSQRVIADTSTLTVAINAGGFSNDAEYLNAAINAIQHYTSRKIKLVKPFAKPDVLFWLSSKELPPNAIKDMKTGSIVFQYATGKILSVSTWIEISGGIKAIQTKQVPVSKRITYIKEDTGSPVWKDGFGQPLLTLGHQNNISFYTFYSRLDPEWSDLVWSPEFVKLLMPLILPNDFASQQENLDRRSISKLQIAPGLQLKAESGKPAYRPGRLKTESIADLKYYLWFLLMIAFIIERYISFKNTAV